VATAFLLFPIKG